MPRNWPLWSAFFACLLAVIAAVAWLSAKVVAADRAEIAAERKAELEENARLALWRMEAAMTAIVGQESARPPSMYRGSASPAAQPGGQGVKAPTTPLTSPLFAERPPYILLHFEIDPAGEFLSPQLPFVKVEKSKPKQLQPAPFPEGMQQDAQRLDELVAAIDLPKMMANLPQVERIAGEGVASDQLQAPPGMWSPAVTHPPQTAATVGAQPSDDPFADASIGAPQVAAAEDPFGPLPAAPAPVAQQSAEPAADRFEPESKPHQQIGQRDSVFDDLPQQQAANQAPLFQQSSALKESRAVLQGENEFQARQRFAETNRRAQVVTANAAQAYSAPREPASAEPVSSVMTPWWVGGHLLLVRRVIDGERTFVQGCELNWPALRHQLQDEIADLLPAAEIEPIYGDDSPTGLRRLAALPVKLIPGPLPSDASAGLSSIRLSLVLTWGAIGVAIAAAAALLRGVIALGERRAAFVSAVTHELRTPLTTFRMYAEMLSEGMVKSEPERLQYLRTLRIEADRLTHLVANVLAYARLERGRPVGRMVAEPVGKLLDVVTPRLVDRASEARLVLAVEAAPEVQNLAVLTDTAAVEQILFNLVDNACKYATEATNRELAFSITADARRIVLRLRDHGPGISAAQQRWLFQPFRKSARDAAHSAPGVGLGLALCRRLARQLGGELSYEPAPDGACFVLTLPRAIQA